MISSHQQHLEEQARSLANFNREADSTITRILWFPHEREIRMVLVSPEIARAMNDTEVRPFYFKESPVDGLASPSAIAMIAPEEERTLTLPSGWGSWDDAVEL